MKDKRIRFNQIEKEGGANMDDYFMNFILSMLGGTAKPASVDEMASALQQNGESNDYMVFLPSGNGYLISNENGGK